ncbi:MAG: hypothetical protein KF819_39825 [Labilithrix sp.]|nr:hypothetical protein [Labilithrix sp.]
MQRILVALAVGLSLAACGGATDVPPSSSSSSSSSGGGGGDRACTAIGCTDGLGISVTAPAGWKAGRYVFTVTADGSTQTCEGSLPLPSCGSPGLLCKGQDGVAQIGESGCALPAAQHSFSDIHFSSTPAQVNVHVARDGVVLAEQSFTPSYVTSQPNGPGCEPICKQASGSLTLQEP